MKTLHLSIIMAGIILGFPVFLSHLAAAHLIPGFSIQPDQNYADPITHRLYTKEIHPHIVLSRDSEFTLPMIIKSEVNDSMMTSYLFHITDGNDFTAEIMPQGTLIQVAPNQLLVSDGVDQKFNIVIKVGKNTPSGIYEPNLVTKWNNNITSSMEITPIPFQVGKWNWDSLTRQVQSGISAKHVVCRSALQIVVIKSKDGSPACARLQTAQKLVERGWAKEIISNVSGSETTVIIPVNSSNPETGLTLSPSTVKVAIGVNSTVKWINMDSVMNDITSDTGFFETSLISPGHAWEYIFDKSGTYQYHSSIHPWLKGTIIVFPIFANGCGQFYTAPHDIKYTGSETYPVLILKQNSIGCAKLTYTINFNYNDNKSGSIWSQMLNYTDMFHIGKYNYTAHGNSFGVSSIDTMQMFKTKSIPEVVDLAKYTVGSQFTITLIIQPLPNATGFYDYSIPAIPCDSYPLEVGYNRDQVNSSDFSKGMVTMHNHSCANMPYEISSVQVSGMDFKLVKFQ